MISTVYTEESSCPPCLELPEWQWNVLAQPEDFCARHHFLRFASVDELSSEELLMAEATLATCGEWPIFQRLEDYTPERFWHCSGCNKYVYGFFCSLEAHAYDGCSYSYMQVLPSPWDTDDYASPLYSGMRRRS